MTQPQQLTLDRPDGMTKLIVEPDSERILGVGIVGAGAGELIGEGVVAIEMGATAREKIRDRYSIEVMVQGYERLIESIYARKVSVVPSR